MNEQELVNNAIKYKPVETNNKSTSKRNAQPGRAPRSRRTTQEGVAETCEALINTPDFVNLENFTIDDILQK